MFHLPSSAGRFWRLFSFPCLLLVGAACAGGARAQMGGIETDPGTRGTGGDNIIDGRLYYASGQMVDRKVKVRLTSVTGADFFTMSDDSGAFSFRRLAAGSYTLYVDAGKDFLPITERVDIIQNLRRGGGNYSLQLILRLKPPASEGPATLLNAALAGVPKGAAAHYEGALKAAQAGDGKKAVELFKKAIALHPRFALAYGEMGVEYFKLGDLDNAADALSEATKLEPNSFGPRLNYGIVLFYKKKYGEAGGELDRALKINEKSGPAHLFRGRVYVKAGDFGQAEKAFLRAISLGGKVNEAHRFLGGIYNEQRDYGRAIKELEIYLHADPNVADAEQIRQILQELRAKEAAGKK